MTKLLDTFLSNVCTEYTDKTLVCMWHDTWMLFESVTLSDFSFVGTYTLIFGYIYNKLFIKYLPQEKFVISADNDLKSLIIRLSPNPGKCRVGVIKKGRVSIRRMDSIWRGLCF